MSGSPAAGVARVIRLGLRGSARLARATPVREGRGAPSSVGSCRGTKRTQDPEKKLDQRVVAVTLWRKLLLFSLPPVYRGGCHDALSDPRGARPSRLHA